MCESHTVHNLCGHIKIKTIVQCPEMTELILKGALENAKPQINGQEVDFAEFNDKTRCTHQLCADVSDNSHIFPDMCDKCKSSGVVGSWVEQDRGAKLQVFRSWRLKRRTAIYAASHEVESGSNGVQQEAAWEVEGKSLENLEFIAAPSVSEESTTDPNTQSPQDRTHSIASNATSNSTTPSLHDIRTRVERLRARTDHLIAKISFQRAARNVQNSSR